MPIPMFKLFGKGKRSDSEESTRMSKTGISEPEYSILLKSNGEVKFVSLRLKECFLSNDIYDVSKVLPEKLKQICQSVFVPCFK